jgi:diacylglycerol kinase family enzyme
MAVALDDGPPVSRPALMLSVLVGRREGGFVMGPNARMTDGLFDYVLAGKLSRWEVTCLLPRIALFGVPPQYPQVEMGRCRQLHLASKNSLIVHIDGEFFCKPEDGVRELEIDLLPGRLQVRRLFGS